jgi:glycine dehydrogenase
MAANTLLDPSDTFVRRQIGPSPADIERMLAALGYASLDELVDATVPASIRQREPLVITPGSGGGEHELLAKLGTLAKQNVVARSYLGMGYHACITPPVIARNILEDPGWYTQYTPYQAEISQGRLEALLNFQTMISDLTGLELANASMLDEPTAAAEAMAMCRSIARGKKQGFFVLDDCHPQTIAVVRTRAWSMGIELTVGPAEAIDFAGQDLAGVLVQYPTTDGRVRDYADLADRAHDAGALLVIAADLLALVLLRSPGTFGADIAVGSAQRFGVPMGYGGPHAAYMATSQAYARKMPGRIVGVSKDVHGKAAYRLAIQTREQHIKRDRATSNICTAQVLLAVMAGMYAVYHGPEGLRRIARRVHAMTAILAQALRELGHDLGDEPFFDTLRVRLVGRSADTVIEAANQLGINLRRYDDQSVGVALDETTTRNDLAELLPCFGQQQADIDTLAQQTGLAIADPFARTEDLLSHDVFKRYHSETELLRYMHRLRGRDLSLTTSMIPLGSCTMKLNGSASMLPISWPGFSALHPFAPAQQARGYAALCEQLSQWLAAITGLPAVSLQPNAGSQGEYAGLLAIRRYHESRDEAGRNVCLIPVSAHGTNPASAVLAGFKVVTVACDPNGNIALDDLRAKAEAQGEQLGALMITYPSTHGVFEESVVEVCRIVHDHGGQVYLDGANLNAMVGLCRLADLGADVCHINLHKTFAIPHGGGGPGMGPITAAAHLEPFLPPHPLDRSDHGVVAAAPYGSAGILPISWMYIALLGGAGLKRASQVAILNANYMAHRLREHYPVLYAGRNGRVAHEFIIDCRAFRTAAGIDVEDLAKRLMDYGFHAPTMSWPVAGTLMIEPTESESKAELDRLCDALIFIRAEIDAIEQGQADKVDNILKRAPHTAEDVTADQWDRPYSRAQAAYPAPWLRDDKFWPAVGRIDNPHGDRNLVCTCPPLEAYNEH